MSYARTACYAVVSVAVLLGCRQNTSDAAERECLSGEPRPIFSETINGIAAHAFESNGQSATETISFADGTAMDIAQAGCDTLRQDLSFLLPPEFASWPSAKREISARLNRYGTLAPQLLGLGQYADMIEQIPDGAPEARPEILAPGLALRYYRVPVDAGTGWRIRLTQDLSPLSAPR